ncbi:serine protease [Elizabethkingia argentiflava]|uniref:Serine protease n=1 Tax=Elizabethkingia argenteiflava TaxID=2681556 RepID=A0A845PWW8_9FLAO|nr:serine protease [Elizabethkingia argenteiflava]NAW50947.1 serine protease [Elizabethkingia argenteiflava]
MFEFLNGLPPLEKAFWYVALVSSIIFLIQSVMTFIGGIASEGLDIHFNGDLDHTEVPFQFFSFRNLINFLLGFGWTGVVFYPLIENKYLLTLLATCIGVLFICIFFIIIRQLLKLSENNTFNIEDLLKLSGRVYISIPANMRGQGKVQISVKGAYHELEAMTESPEAMEVGTTVVVKKIKNKILIVEKLN